ncbi:hypothetical protein SAMN05216548_101366 [Faunimonas pinastri]|uniref:Secreted protein n=1 Tax=Faunimonas pinastri TaxID=1855383 RepID=A0A1H9A9R2_9HYPH|nr:hypothetical protein [Faunimonas pinastri]SEP73399.1 hypothetical protein SAMN05216548_101366 [Faunimonas pinastri]
MRKTSLALCCLISLTGVALTGAAEAADRSPLERHILSALRCREDPHPTAVLQFLQKKNLIVPAEGKKLEHETCWQIKGALSVEGLPVKAICGAERDELIANLHPEFFDHGESRGRRTVLALNTGESKKAVRAWAHKHDIWRDEVRDGKFAPGTVDVECNSEEVPD